MSNKHIEAGQIKESLLVTYTAHCDKCGNDRDEYHDTADNFSRQLHNEGWRVTNDGSLWCPKCAKDL